MRFIFDETKAAQAAAYLLDLAGGRMNYMKLIKLLYLADRESLLEIGRPITGDKYVMMRRGPVLSRVYDLILEQPRTTDTPWFEYIRPAVDYEVVLAAPAPSTDRLSPFERSILQKHFERYNKIDPFALVDLMHETLCPEWEDPGDTSHPLHPEAILRAWNKSQQDIERLGCESRELELMHKLQ